MDQRKLVAIIEQYPQLWDRTHPYFREKEYKEKIFNEIGNVLGYPGKVCKETFKSIREKYIREREKSTQLGTNYKQWELLTDLKFLDPHIVCRKQNVNEEDIQRAEKYRNEINSESSLIDNSPTDFDKHLISLVKKTEPIWDRKSNTYPNKHVKHQLWQTISQTLKRDVNTCMLRWKALREKYIRQKTKFHDGEHKWELLDDMTFLDKVIQYRRKNNETNDYYYSNNSSSCDYNQPSQSPQQNFSKINESFKLNVHESETSRRQVQKNSESDHNVYLSYGSELGDDNSLNDSSDEYLVIKQENPVFELPDSSIDLRTTTLGGSSKRTINSESSEAPIEKKRSVEVEKSPESVFGDLVAVMLRKKPENERNLAMIEIMKVLTK